MNYLRLALAVLAATVYQFFLEAAWYVALFPNLAAHDLGPIQRADPLLFFNFASELGLSLLVAFVLAQRAGRITLARTLAIGAVLGGLAGLNQYADWYGSFNVSAGLLLNFWIKDLLLAAGSSLIITAVQRFPGRSLS